MKIRDIIGRWRAGQEARRELEARHEARKRIAVRDWHGRLWIAFDGQPLVDVEELRHDWSGVLDGMRQTYMQSRKERRQ